MAIKNSWASGEVLTAADLTDTMKGVSINPQTGTSYTFALTDGFVTLSNASGGTATIPTNTTAAFNTGAVIGVMNAGTAGSFVIAPAATVTLNAVSGTTTLAPLESATLVKLGTNTWQLAKGSGLPKATYSATTGSPTVTTPSGKTCVKFTGSGSLTCNKTGSVDILIVGGGGGGGGSQSGGYTGPGGGAGGYLYLRSVQLTNGVTYTVTVGGGGTSSTGSGYGTNGNASLVDAVWVGGGGTGGISGATGGAPYKGLDGASGGGGGANSTAGGAALYGEQGNAGATAGASGAGGGGGGSSAASTTTTGGAGTANSITGSSITYATGGTAGANVNGTANEGDGAGGSTTASTTGGSGGSGVVIFLFG